MPNFSEGRGRSLIALLAAGPEVLDVHADADHHRSVVTLASADLEALARAVFARVEFAVARIDLRVHAGVHPRVGAADVVPLVPLGSASMADAVEAAHRLGERIWGELRVPVFFYGEAAGGRRLAEIRAGRVPPDLGDAPHPTAGAVCVGARPPLVAYNLVFTGLEAGEARSAAGRLRALPGVQALAFPVSGGAFQLSMNLTRLGAVGVGAAYEESVRLVGRPGRPELVGLCPAAAAGPGCDGALLEGRLAASAAAQGAAAARARGGEEMMRLAARLDAESHSLRELAGGQEAVLAGAERAAALVRVLRAAQIEDAGLEALLSVAAAGLRAAVTAETAARFATRLALLDRPNAR